MTDITSDPFPAFRLDGRTIVITGGYGQIGQSLVKGCIRSGAKVAIIEPHASSKITKDIFGDIDDFENVVAFVGDVTDKVSLENAAQKVADQLGVVTGLINNAALDSPPNSSASENGPFEDYPEESWDEIMNVNVKGVFQCCQVFGKMMANHGEGSIINIASIYGSVSPDQNLYQYRRDKGEVFYKPVAYSASKSALYNLTRYLAVYWGSKGVRTNTLTFAGVFNHQDKEFLEAYQKKIPLDRGANYSHLSRMASPDDFVCPAVFLLSSGSSYVTGADLRVDGGFLAT